MTRRTTAIAVLTMALSTVPAAAQNQEPHPGPAIHAIVGAPMDAIGPIIQMMQTLDLSADQKQQIHSLLMQTLEADDSAKQIMAATRQLHAAVLAEVPDPQALDTIKASLNAAHAAELDRHIDLMLKVAQTLTSEQRQQLLKLHASGQ